MRDIISIVMEFIRIFLVTFITVFTTFSCVIMWLTVGLTKENYTVFLINSLSSLLKIALIFSVLEVIFYRFILDSKR